MVSKDVDTMTASVGFFPALSRDSESPPQTTPLVSVRPGLQSRWAQTVAGPLPSQVLCERKGRGLVGLLGDKPTSRKIFSAHSESPGSGSGHGFVMGRGAKLQTVESGCGFVKGRGRGSGRGLLRLLGDDRSLREAVPSAMENLPDASLPEHNGVKTDTNTAVSEHIIGGEASTEAPADLEVPEAVTDAPADLEVPEAVTDAPADLEVPEAVTDAPADLEVPEAVTDAPADSGDPEALTDTPADSGDPEDTSLDSEIPEAVTDSGAPSLSERDVSSKVLTDASPLPVISSPSKQGVGDAPSTFPSVDVGKEDIPVCAQDVGRGVPVVAVGPPPEQGNEDTPIGNPLATLGSSLDGRSTSPVTASPEGNIMESSLDKGPPVSAVCGPPERSMSPPKDTAMQQDGSLPQSRTNHTSSLDKGPPPLHHARAAEPPSSSSSGSSFTSTEGLKAKPVSSNCTRISLGRGQLLQSLFHRTSPGPGRETHTPVAASLTVAHRRASDGAISVPREGQELTTSGTTRNLPGGEMEGPITATFSPDESNAEISVPQGDEELSSSPAKDVTTRSLPDGEKSSSPISDGTAHGLPDGDKRENETLIAATSVQGKVEIIVDPVCTADLTICSSTEEPTKDIHSVPSPEVVPSPSELVPSPPFPASPEVLPPPEVLPSAEVTPPPEVLPPPEVQPPPEILPLPEVAVLSISTPDSGRVSEPLPNGPGRKKRRQSRKKVTIAASFTSPPSSTSSRAVVRPSGCSRTAVQDIPPASVTPVCRSSAEPQTSAPSMPPQSSGQPTPLVPPQPSDFITPDQPLLAPQPLAPARAAPNPRLSASVVKPPQTPAFQNLPPINPLQRSTPHLPPAVSAQPRSFKSLICIPATPTNTGAPPIKLMTPSDFTVPYSPKVADQTPSGGTNIDSSNRVGFCGGTNIDSPGEVGTSEGTNITSQGGVASEAEVELPSAYDGPPEVTGLPANAVSLCDPNSQFSMGALSRLEAEAGPPDGPPLSNSSQVVGAPGDVCPHTTEEGGTVQTSAAGEMAASSECSEHTMRDVSTPPLLHTPSPILPASAAEATGLLTLSPTAVSSPDASGPTVTTLSSIPPLTRSPAAASARSSIVLTQECTTDVNAASLPASRADSPLTNEGSAIMTSDHSARTASIAAADTDSLSVGPPDDDSASSVLIFSSASSTLNSPVALEAEQHPELSGTELEVSSTEPPLAAASACPAAACSGAEYEAHVRERERGKEEGRQRIVASVAVSLSGGGETEENGEEGIATAMAPVAVSQRSEGETGLREEEEVGGRGREEEQVGIAAAMVPVDASLSGGEEADLREKEWRSKEEVEQRIASLRRSVHCKQVQFSSCHKICIMI